MKFLATDTFDEKPRRAFTLLELLAVIAIIAVLAGLVLGAARRASESGRIARATAELSALSVALENYRLAYGDYPQTDDSARLLQSLLGKRGPGNAPTQGRALIDLTRFTTSSASDPFVDASAVLVDPWEHAYVYVYQAPAANSTDPSYVLYSVGPDGRDTPGLPAGAAGDPAQPGNADNIYAGRY